MNIIVTYKIKDYREKNNISIRELARMSGVSKSHISAIENDETIPTIRTLCYIATALNVKPEELYNYIVYR